MIILMIMIIICCCPVTKSCPTLCDSMDCSPQDTLSFTISWEFAQTHVLWVVMLSIYLILCCPLLFLPSIFLSIRVFSSESVLCIRWPKHRSFSYTPVVPRFGHYWVTRQLPPPLASQGKEAWQKSHLTNNCLLQRATPRGRFSAWSLIIPAFLLFFFQMDFPSGTGAPRGGKKVLLSLHIQTWDRESED